MAADSGLGSGGRLQQGVGMCYCHYGRNIEKKTAPKSHLSSRSSMILRPRSYNDAMPSASAVCWRLTNDDKETDT
jgi:hypothetical protein